MTAIAARWKARLREMFPFELGTGTPRWLPSRCRIISRMVVLSGRTVMYLFIVQVITGIA